MTAATVQDGLVDWTTRNGGFLHQGVEIAQNVDRGTHVRVRNGHTIRSGTRIASCPMNVILSVLNALDASPFTCHGTKFPSSFLGKQSATVIQYFFLMEQRVLGQKSWWAPYLACLPTPGDIDDFLFLSEEDLKWIAGTNLSHAVETQSGKWKSMYEDALEQLRRSAWTNAVNGCYTWQLFLWAATIFGSRSFTSEVLQDTPPADRARPMGNRELQHEEMTKLFSDGFAVLVPLLDFLNYKPYSRVEWQARFSFVGLQVLENFEAGQEVCNNYGPRDNETLLLGYGFAISSNPFDHFSVALKAPPGSPLADARTWHSPPKTEDDCKYYIFNVDHPRSKSAAFLELSLFSLDLLDGMSVLCANDRELQTMYLSRRSLISFCLAHKKIENARNLLSTIAQLALECRRRLTVLESTDPLKEHPHLKPTSRKQQYAKVYRDSQLAILASAIMLCSFCLSWARSTMSQAEVLQQMHDLPDVDSRQSALSNIQKLISRHSMLLKQGELFSLDQLAAMSLPGEVDTVQGIIDKVLTTVNEQKITEASTKDCSKPNVLLPDNEYKQMRFAVLLAFLQVGFLKNVNSLSRRLRSWFDSLTSWYPTEDPNWCQPPPTTSATMVDYAFWLDLMARSGREALGQLGAGTEMQELRSDAWFQTEVLCWAWNVAAEEGIYLSADVNDGSSLSKEQRPGAAEYLLYIPHDVK